MSDLQPKVDQVEGLLAALAITSEVRWVAQAGAPPPGWLACDGSVVSQATYPTLYAALGTTWGPDGGGNFTLPDLRGRSPVGAGLGAGLTNRVVGAGGGEETHLLSTAEMPSHDHTGSTVGATITMPNVNPNVGSGFRGVTHGGGVVPNPAAVSSTGSISVAAQGGGGLHNTMHPFAVLQPIIKT